MTVADYVVFVAGTVLPALAVAWAAAWGVRCLGPRFGLIDRPGKRKIHTAPMPTSGGLAIWLALVLPLAVGQLLLWAAGNGDAVSLPGLLAFVRPHWSGLGAQSGRLWQMLAGGTVLMLLGLWDDRRGLPWPVRLAVETAVALVMVRCGWRMTLFVDLPWLTGTLSVLWIVGLINSFNMLDNMDGLSAGVAAIAATMLTTMMLLAPAPAGAAPHLFVAGFLLVFLGALIGFLGHNRPPARLFMGDAGSYLIGFLLAMVTLAATFAGPGVPRHAILGPLCVLAVPLYDTMTVVFIRLCSGRSPFVGDKSHFSHRLVELGMTKGQAVLTIYLATATCGLGALLLYQVNTAGALVILLMVGLVLVLIGTLELAGRRTRMRHEDSSGDAEA
jgi:UDP-GlcNAc:undecaprenyl-phosphate GlcNAc-1-phosphate transferase